MSEQEQQVLVKKLANVLVPNAEHRVPGGSPKRVIDAFQAHYGGLWVGGTVCLKEDSLDFRPNGINRLAHKGDMRRTIHLRDVVSVEDRKGWFTSIVDVHTHDASKLTFRCYGAARFSQAIRDQVSWLRTQS
jgi:hypothetical protein